MIALTLDAGTVNMRYRVEDMPDGLILTAKKFLKTISNETIRFL